MSISAPEQRAAYTLWQRPPQFELYDLQEVRGSGTTWLAWPTTRTSRRDFWPRSPNGKREAAMNNRLVDDGDFG